ncbi:hypothetical protein CKO28_20475 [Rhodovibrio sodomensis]|uniref:Uncharacterized protein n=1 Tax=Rhodovibrio sodomensis TaxID=1088 RepID=A0ABS1DKY7_9PROT|nr:hypothetical protein [Rhodovibrio sodomensis]MBK1670403.1 hypothetical protein [Rhodovibrio sodomensis]
MIILNDAQYLNPACWRAAQIAQESSRAAMRRITRPRMQRPVDPTDGSFAATLTTTLTSLQPPAPTIDDIETDLPPLDNGPHAAAPGAHAHGAGVGLALLQVQETAVQSAPENARPSVAYGDTRKRTPSIHDDTA